MSNKKVEETFDTLDDARKDESGKLSDKKRTRTPSGHIIEWSDEKNYEHVTLQHRTGSLLQMQPDGSVRIMSANGKLGIEVNGEGYVKVTGAYNVKVDGDAAFRIEGDVDWHVGGDMRTTVDGTLSFAAKNMTTSIKEKYEMTAQNASIHLADNAVFTAGHKMYLGSTSDMQVKSGEILYVIGSTKVDINP